MAKKIAFTFLVLAFCLSAGSVVSAQDKPYILTAGAGFAKWLEDGAPSGSFGFLAGMHYKIPSTPALAIGAEGGYLMLGGEDETEVIESIPVEASYDLSAIPITGQVTYFIGDEGAQAMPFVTAGGGFYQLRTSVEASAMGVSLSDTDTSSEVGMNFGGGVKMNTDSSVSFGADARFHLVFTEGESTNLLTVMGRVFF
jgi:opacity protein-like surface antigen